MNKKIILITVFWLIVFGYFCFSFEIDESNQIKKITNGKYYITNYALSSSMSGYAIRNSSTHDSIGWILKYKIDSNSKIIYIIYTTNFTKQENKYIILNYDSDIIDRYESIDEMSIDNKTIFEDTNEWITPNSDFFKN